MSAATARSSAVSTGWRRAQSLLFNLHFRTGDISGGGCYVETLLPFPRNARLSVTFWLDSEKITSPAVVRTCDGGVGMGIEFTGSPRMYNSACKFLSKRSI